MSIREHISTPMAKQVYKHLNGFRYQTMRFVIRSIGKSVGHFTIEPVQPSWLNSYLQTKCAAGLVQITSRFLLNRMCSWWTCVFTSRYISTTLRATHHTASFGFNTDALGGALTDIRVISDN